MLIMDEDKRFSFTVQWAWLRYVELSHVVGELVLQIKYLLSYAGSYLSQRYSVVATANNYKSQ